MIINDFMTDYLYPKKCLKKIFLLIILTGKYN